MTMDCLSRLACEAGRRKGGRKVKMIVGGNDPPASDLLVLHSLVFPLSLPFGHLPRRLHLIYLREMELKCKIKYFAAGILQGSSLGAEVVN